MDVRRAERHAGAPDSTGDRRRSERSAEGSSGSAFPRLLTEAGRRLHAAADGPRAAAADNARTIRTVRSGDTLSHMVQAALHDAGMPVNAGVLYRAVGIVAGANRLTDPDRIRPGQAIDLSAVVPGGKPDGRNAEIRRDGVIAEADESAVGILHGLKAFMQSFAGRFTSSFGPRADPVTGARAFHAGVDIRMPAGSLIYPAAPGRVLFSGRTLGYGNLVVLAHAGGFTTSYGHNASNLIPAGTAVDREMPIAVVGATGRATGPHLHFEVRKDGRPIDPDVRRLESGDHGDGQDL